MTNEEFQTLAHTTSLKITRRTTFQDELEAAVSARASRTKTDRFSYSDDFSEDEDDFLNELLTARKQRTDAFKAGKTKSKINDFELSDDDGKQGTAKRVSFLKTQNIRCPSEDTAASEPHEHEPEDVSVGEHFDDRSLFSSQQSTNASQDGCPITSNSVESTHPQTTRDNSSKSLSFQTSDDTLLDLPLPLSSDSSVMESPGPYVLESRAEERLDVIHEENSQILSVTALKRVTSADSLSEREPPRPKPRQRTLGFNLQATEKTAEDAECQDSSRQPTSSSSIPVSADTPSNITRASSPVRSSSPQWTDEVHADSCGKSASRQSERSFLLTKSTVDSESRAVDDFTSDDSKEQERKYSTSFEEFYGESRNHSIAEDTYVHDKSSDSSPQSTRSQKLLAVSSRKVESKYLGTLKVLDHKVPQESQPQAADSLRAAIYQQWLTKKKEKSRENRQIVRREEILNEKKKREEETKKEDAVASYEAWKTKKVEYLKAKAKEKQSKLRKQQMEKEEKEEKRQSAKQVFEKWKLDHDHLLKEKYRKQKASESQLKQKKEEEEEDRKRESKSAFSDWYEKKKDILQDQVTLKRLESKTKAEEEQYMQEERDRMALEMYEHWLARKDLEQKRQREERRIQAILRDSPPPPWSPPNKTVPFRK